MLHSLRTPSPVTMSNLCDSCDPHYVLFTLGSLPRRKRKVGKTVLSFFLNSMFSMGPNFFQKFFRRSLLFLKCTTHHGLPVAVVGRSTFQILDHFTKIALAGLLLIGYTMNRGLCDRDGTALRAFFRFHKNKRKHTGTKTANPSKLMTCHRTLIISPASPSP